MSYECDFLFIDCVSPYAYETSMLKTRALGGSEATLIKIAEGIAALGLKVIVAEKQLLVPIMGDNVIYIPFEEVHLVDSSITVHMRDVTFKSKHPKQYVWMHDMPTQDPQYYKDRFGDVKPIYVSHFQKNQYDNGKSVIYNPIHDKLYEYGSNKLKYDPHKLVWLSSPHKDLEYAVTVFDRLRERSKLPYRLHVFNPGYIGVNRIDHPHITYEGALSNHEMIKRASDALCLFMPMNKWKETFCIVAAEMNSLGIPVAAFSSRDALDEVAPSCLSVNEDDLISKVIHWSKGSRPNPKRNKKYRLTEIVSQWIKLI